MKAIKLIQTVSFLTVALIAQSCSVDSGQIAGPSDHSAATEETFSGTVEARETTGTKQDRQATNCWYSTHCDVELDFDFEVADLHLVFQVDLDAVDDVIPYTTTRTEDMTLNFSWHGNLLNVDLLPANSASALTAGGGAVLGLEIVHGYCDAITLLEVYVAEF